MARTLLSSVSPGFRHDSPTDASAARWKTASGRASATARSTSRRVEQVHLLPRRRGDGGGAVGEQVGQMAPDEAGGAGDEDAHRRATITPSDRTPANGRCRRVAFGRGCARRGPRHRRGRHQGHPGRRHAGRGLRHRRAPRPPVDAAHGAPPRRRRLRLVHHGHVADLHRLGPHRRRPDQHRRARVRDPRGQCAPALPPQPAGHADRVHDRRHRRGDRVRGGRRLRVGAGRRHRDRRARPADDRPPAHVQHPADDRPAPGLDRGVRPDAAGGDRRAVRRAGAGRRRPDLVLLGRGRQRRVRARGQPAARARAGPAPPACST